MTAKHKDESGAYAILFAIMVIFLAGMGALVVDIGNAVARKSDVQGQADFAALAGARESDGNLTNPVPWVIVDKVRDYLNENHPRNRPCGTACVNSSQLVDCPPGANPDADPQPACFKNGEVRFANDGIQVHTPEEFVDYGLIEGVIPGWDGRFVQADATVGLFSPDFPMMPVYAVNPCDYGRQTITDPANGQVTPVEVPPLAYDSDTNNTDLTGVTPNQIDVNAPSVELTLTGSRWDSIRVGFFPSDGGAPVVATEFIDPANVVHPYDPPLAYTTNGNAGYSVRVTVPPAVASTEKVWYIRVFNGPPATGQWSPRNEAQPLRVGEPVLECDAGSNEGNFGTLKFERTDESSVNDQLAMNIADGLEAPLSLTKHLQWDSTGLCTDGISGAVVSDLPNPGLRKRTNCVDTDTGLPANAATAGLITGEHIGAPGSLVSSPTTGNCDPSNGSDELRVRIQNTNYDINNDVLTCFLTNTTTSLADITSRTYSGGEVLDLSLLDSPRFFLVPVLHVEPNNGGSNKYSIIDFRPAFLTDEAPTNSATKGNSNASAENGLHIENNGVTQIKVVFFHFDALPRDTEGDVIDYIGVGEPILRLID
jgi:hypothetical protein